MTSLELPPPQKCKLYHDLWTDRSWVHRRIDEISFTERGMLQVKSTFDLDITHLKEKIGSLPEELRKGDQIALPLMALPRTLLLDIDVTLDGKTQSFASTETSTDITRHIYLQEYFSKYIPDPIKLSEFSSFEELSPGSLEKMNYISTLTDHIFREGGKDYIRQKREHTTKEFDRYDNKMSAIKEDSTLKQNVSQDTINRLSEKLAKCAKELSILDQVAPPYDDKNFSSELYRMEKWLRFSEDYIAVVLVDLPSDRRRAKLTFVTKTSPDYSDSPSILPIRFSPRRFTSPSLLGSGIEKRYHFRVNAPDGHYISSINLTDVRDNNNEAFFKPNIPPKNSSREEEKQVKSITCETADGANLTFLEIKDNTLQEEGNIFGYTLNIGVEPFPQTFIFRALVSIFFLLFYMLFARFAVFESGRIIPFSIAALGFLASSPLWFRIGSEDAFTHRTLRRGRTILGWLSAAAFLASFGVQLVNSKAIASATPKGHGDSCIALLNDHMLVNRIVNDQFICGRYSRLFKAYPDPNKDKSKLLETLINHSWELVFTLCILYVLGICWFFARTYFQKSSFIGLLSTLKVTSSDRSCRQVYLTLLSYARRVLTFVLAVSLFFAVIYSIFLTFRSLSELINDVFKSLFNSGKDYYSCTWALMGIILLFYLGHHLLDPALWNAVSNLTKRGYRKLPPFVKNIISKLSFYDWLILFTVSILILAMFIWWSFIFYINEVHQVLGDVF